MTEMMNERDAAALPRFNHGNAIVQVDR